MDAIIKLLKWLEVDRAVMFAVLSKVWLVFAGPITLYLISLYLLPEVQGFYYTFLSLVALKSFLELGFYIVITQFSSHEWSKLELDNNRNIIGDKKALSRLISLGHLIFKWYAVVSAIFIFAVGAGGYMFLSEASDPGIIWKVPWCVLVVLAGLQLWTLPFLSLLEGCNQVKVIYFFRFVLGMICSLSVWLTLYLGFELWMAVVETGIGLLATLILLLVYYRKFFQPFFKFIPKFEIHWKDEIWPMQWRLAVGGFLNYFLFSIYTPVLFHYHGPVVAGQMGMTWQIIMALSSLAMAWVATKVPRFGILIAQKNYVELDRIFFRTSAVSIAVIGIGGFVLWSIIYGLNVFNYSLAERVLAPLPTGLFLIGAMLGQVSVCQSSYLRAHKKEPFFVLSIIYSLSNGILVWLLIPKYGSLGASIGYLVAVSLICIPMGTLIWIRCRSEWHLQN